METSLFECIAHPDESATNVRRNRTTIPWWHYAERVPIKGGPVPKHWIAVTAAIAVIRGNRCDLRGKVPLRICKRCNGKVRNTMQTNYDRCHQCRKTPDKRNTSGDPVCTSCWVNTPVPGKKSCQKCLDVRNARNAERRRQEREW